MGTFILLLIIGLGGSFAAFMAVFRLTSTEAEENVGGLAGISVKRGELSVFDRLNPSGGPIDRLDYFLARVLKLDAGLENLYMLWGRPESTNPLQLLHYKEICAFVLPVTVAYLAETPWALLLMPAAFFLPDLYVKSLIARRQQQIVRHFPALVDLAALTIESGQEYMAAFDRIIKAATKKTDLELEFEKTLNEVQLGYSRREALRRMAMRIGVQDIRSFVGLIIQSDELGTSLVELLRNFSGDMRFKRLNRAEQLAAQASTKMLFAIIFFIFPVVFVLMLAPMLISLFQGGLGF